MFKLIVVFVMTLMVVNAIPLRPDDSYRRVVGAVINSEKDLNEFIDALKHNDNQTAAKMVDFILDIAHDGFQHSIKLTATFNKLKPILSKLSSAPVGLPMKMLATLIDGNRDNKPYYDLETVIEWICKCQAHGIDDELLNTALKAAEESQDSLREMSDSFVNAIKAIRISTKDMGPLMKHTLEIIDAKSGPFINKFQEAINALTAFRAKLS